MMSIASHILLHRNHPFWCIIALLVGCHSGKLETANSNGVIRQTGGTIVAKVAAAPIVLKAKYDKLLDAKMYKATSALVTRKERVEQYRSALCLCLRKNSAFACYLLHGLVHAAGIDVGSAPRYSSAWFLDASCRSGYATACFEMRISKGGGLIASIDRTDPLFGRIASDCESKDPNACLLLANWYRETSGSASIPRKSSLLSLARHHYWLACVYGIYGHCSVYFSQLNYLEPSSHDRRKMMELANLHCDETCLSSDACTAAAYREQITKCKDYDYVRTQAIGCALDGVFACHNFNDVCLLYKQGTCGSSRILAICQHYESIIRRGGFRKSVPVGEDAVIKIGELHCL